MQELIETRKKAVNDAADMLQGLDLNEDELIDTEAMEWKHGGAMFKHLNLPDKMKRNDTEDTANILSVLASKEVPATKHEEHSIETVYKADIHRKDYLKTAPFQQLKKVQLSNDDKVKISLNHSDKNSIRTGKVEVMPLPPKTYSNLKVKEIDLRESIALEKDQELAKKKLHMEIALEKLTSSNGAIPKLTAFEGDESSKMAYRENDNDSDDDEDTNEHINSDCDENEDEYEDN